MVAELILAVVFGLLTWVLGLLPSMSVIALPFDIVSWFSSILTAVAYFLPVTDLLIMLGIWLAITVVEIGWKTITRLWDALPLT